MSKGDKHEGAVATCPLQATLAYRYTDGWRTQIHQFAKFDDKRAGKGGFVTGKPEYLIGGAGQTEAARAAPGTATNEYDARIYSHFSAGAISTIVGAPPKGSPDKEGHERTDIEKRRFLARSLELEVYLYLDSLRFWALDAFAFSREAGPSESPSPSSPSHQGLEDWVSAKRQYWSNVVSKREKTDPSLTLSSQTASDWWDKEKELHQVFVSLADGHINDMEKQLEDHVARVGKLLGVKIPGVDTSNRFWAEGLCETVRETTLVPTVFPQVMEALICNIPARLWAIASPATGDMLLRIMARAAASLVYKLNRELHIASKDTGEEAFNAFLDSFRLPAKESLPEHLQHIHELVARIENINDLIALHAAALHDCFTESIVVKPEQHASELRAVDGVRPKAPTRILCFKSPNASKNSQKPDIEQRQPCAPGDCAGCFEKRCSLLACESEECHAAATGAREFIRQLREQQAALNGTPRARLQANRALVAPKKSLDTSSEAPKDQPSPTTTPLGNSPPETAGEGGTDQVRDTGAQRRASERWLALRSQQLEGQGLSKDDAKAAALAERTSELRRIERSLREQAIADRVEHLRSSGIPEGDLEATARSDVRKAREAKIEKEMRALYTQHKGISETECRKLARRKIREETMGELLESGYQGLAALHALDIIAGGHAVQLLGLGDGSANSAIGRQWTSTPGAKLTEALANGPADKDEVYLNVELVVCPPECALKKASSSASGTNKGTTP